MSDRHALWFVIVLTAACVLLLARAAYALPPPTGSDSYLLTLGLAAEEGARRSDGHAALLWTFRTRSRVTGLSEVAEAMRYCSVLRGFPQSPWGRYLYSITDEAQLRETVPEVAEIVDLWLTPGKTIPNPCNGAPWHFGGRRAASQRPHWTPLDCGDARSVFFLRPVRRPRR